MNTNALSGKKTQGLGIIDCELYKYSMLKHLLGSYMSDRSFTDDERELAQQTFADHGSYAKKYCVGDLTWVGQLSKPLHSFFNLVEAIVFKGQHDETIRQSVRAHRSESETLDVAPLCEQGELVDGLLDARDSAELPPPKNTSPEKGQDDMWTYSIAATAAGATNATAIDDRLPQTRQRLCMVPRRWQSEGSMRLSH